MNVSIVFFNSDGTFNSDCETFIPEEILKFVDEKIAQISLKDLRKILGRVPSKSYYVEV
mgnify:CR=1 FL=1